MARLPLLKAYFHNPGITEMTIAKTPKTLQAALLGAVAMAALLAMDPALAQGLEKANTLVENGLTVLRAISVGVVTIAVIIAGYKIAFTRASFGDVLPFLLGGGLIGGAAEMARWLIN